MNQYEAAFQIVFEAVCELQKMACNESGEVLRWLDDLCIALFQAYFDRKP